MAANLSAALFKNNTKLLGDTRVQTSGAIITKESALRSNAVLKWAGGDVINIRCVQNSSTATGSIDR